MKKILFLFLFVNSMMMEAQKDVTKFLGIPVDGYKTEMIKKLKEKGYQYNSQLDCMTGEFNGRDVYIRIATNNNKPKSVVRSAIIRGQVCNMLRISYLQNCFSNGGH